MNETDGIARVDLMNQLSIRYYRVSVKREHEYAYKAYTLSKELGYKRGETVALKNIGIVKRTNGSPLDSILFYYNSALALAEENEFVDLKIALLNNIGLSLGEHTQYHKALNNLLKCKDLDEAYMPMSWKRALIIANIGALYYKLKDYNIALNYFNESYDIANEHGYDFINLMHIDDMALTKYKLGEKENAQKIIIESLDLIRNQGDFESLYQSMIALIDIRIEEKLIVDAKKLALAMLEELKINNLPLYRCQLYNRFGHIELLLKHSDHALDYSLKSLECAETKTGNLIRTDALKRLYQVYQLSGNNSLKDSIHNKYVEAAEMEFERQINLAVGEEEYKYENLLKEREIELLKEKQKVSNRMMKLLVGGIFCCLLLSIIAGYYYSRKNRIANILSIKNKELTETEKTLEEKNKILEKYIESNIQLSQFAHIASHDLKSPLRTVSSFIGLAKNSAKGKLSTQELEYMDLSLAATKDMYQLVEDLLSYSKVNALQLQIQEIDMPLLLNEVRSHLNYSITEKDAEITTNCLIQTVHGDKTKLRQVIENLISNAIKFVPLNMKPSIVISCEDQKEYWEFSIKDNGIGIAKNYLSQVFEPFKQLNIKGEYSGTGLGLALCKEIVEKHGGQIWIESELGVGTEVFFTLNKSLKENI